MMIRTIARLTDEVVVGNVIELTVAHVPLRPGWIIDGALPHR
jgi:hypothetical protein